MSRDCSQPLMGIRLRNSDIENTRTVSVRTVTICLIYREASLRSSSRSSAMTSGWMKLSKNRKPISSRSDKLKTALRLLLLEVVPPDAEAGCSGNQWVYSIANNTSGIIIKADNSGMSHSFFRNVTHGSPSRLEI